MSTDIFDLETASTHQAPGRREAAITDNWNTGNKTPNGGYLLALMLRGLAADLPHPDPLVAAVSFFKPGAPGPATLESSILRAGRRISTGETHLRQGDGTIAHLTASFRDLDQSSGRTEEFGTPPDLPPPDDCVDPTGLLSGIPIGDRIDYRLPALPGWATGAPSGNPSARYWVRLAGERPVDLFALAFLVDAYPPPVSEIGEPAAVTVQLTVNLYRQPAPGWLACVVSTKHLVRGYHEEDLEIWDSQGRIVAQSRQLALLV